MLRRENPIYASLLDLSCTSLGLTRCCYCLWQGMHVTIALCCRVDMACYHTCQRFFAQHGAVLLCWKSKWLDPVLEEDCSMVAVTWTAQTLKWFHVGWLLLFTCTVFAPCFATRLKV